MHKAAIALLLGALGVNHTDRAPHPHRVVKPSTAMLSSKPIMLVDGAVIKAKAG